jgi:hypothetical protein
MRSFAQICQDISIPGFDAAKLPATVNNVTRFAIACLAGRSRGDGWDEFSTACDGRALPCSSETSHSCAALRRKRSAVLWLRDCLACCAASAAKTVPNQGNLILTRRACVQVGDCHRRASTRVVNSRSRHLTATIDQSPIIVDPRLAQPAAMVNVISLSQPRVHSGLTEAAGLP